VSLVLLLVQRQYALLCILFRNLASMKRLCGLAYPQPAIVGLVIAVHVGHGVDVVRRVN
jgi:hypothetical protein